MRTVPRWAIGSAVTAPTSLIVGDAIAQHLDTGPYDPMSQTLSVLAAHGGGSTAMTAAFVVTACCHVVTAAGLKPLRPAPRVALATAGACGLAVAVFRQPMQGSSVMHLLSATAVMMILTVWPLLAMTRDPAAPGARRVRYATAATSVLALLLGWLFVHTQGGDMLGLSERTAVVAQTVWPIAVATTMWRRERQNSVIASD